MIMRKGIQKISIIIAASAVVLLLFSAQLIIQDGEPHNPFADGRIKLEYERTINMCSENVDREFYATNKPTPEIQNFDQEDVVFITIAHGVCNFEFELFGAQVLAIMEFINLYKLLITGNDGSANEIGQLDPALAKKFRLVEPLYFHQARNNTFWENEFKRTHRKKVCPLDTTMHLRGQSKSEVFENQPGKHYHKGDLGCYLGAAMTRFGEVHDLSKLESYLGVEVIRWDDFASMGKRDIQLICTSKTDHCSYKFQELNGFFWNVTQASQLMSPGGIEFRKDFIGALLQSEPGIVGVPYLRNGFFKKAFLKYRTEKEFDFSNIMPLLMPNQARLEKAMNTAKNMKGTYVAFHWRRGDRLQADAHAVRTQTPEFVASMLNSVAEKYGAKSVLLITNSENQKEISSIRSLTNYPIVIYKERKREWQKEGIILVEEMAATMFAVVFVGSGHKQYHSNISTLMIDWIIIGKYKGNLDAARPHILSPTGEPMLLLYDNITEDD